MVIERKNQQILCVMEFPKVFEEKFFGEVSTFGSTFGEGQIRKLEKNETKLNLQSYGYAL